MVCLLALAGRYFSLVAKSNLLKDEFRNHVLGRRHRAREKADGGVLFLREIARVPGVEISSVLCRYVRVPDGSVGGIMNVGR